MESTQNDTVFYRANLFQKNVATQIDSESLEIALNLNHSLVNITDTKIEGKYLDGKSFKYAITKFEDEIMTMTHIGTFDNGQEFRLIQPKGVSLEMAKSNHNAKGGFSLGSKNTNGWAVHFFLTDKDDIRETNISEKGEKEQIQKLIQGSMMGVQFGMPEKFLEFSKRLLPMIKQNPSQLHDFADSIEFIEIIKNNTEAYSQEEVEIINKI